VTVRKMSLVELEREAVRLQILGWEVTRSIYVGWDLRFAIRLRRPL